MANDRTMTLHFNDGTRLTFDFPEQANNPAARQIKLSEFTASRNVIVQAGNQVMIFPVTSIKYISLASAESSFFRGTALPKQAIIGARLVE